MNEADTVADPTRKREPGDVSDLRTLRATYRESIAPSQGRGARSWTQTVPVGGAPIEQLHLPHGGVEIRWHRHGVPVVVGPTVEPRVDIMQPGDEVIGFRFAPGRCPPSDSASIAELVDGVYPLEAVTGIRCEADGADAVEVRRFALLRALTPWLSGERDDRARTLVDAAHHRDQLVATAAHSAGWSERHARRAVRRVTGLSYRDLRHLGRFQRFVALAQHDVAHRQRRPPVELAIDAGYSDQSHLQRACRQLAGLTLTKYLDRTHHHCAGHDHPA